MPVIAQRNLEHKLVRHMFTEARRAIALNEARQFRSEILSGPNVGTLLMGIKTIDAGSRGHMFINCLRIKWIPSTVINHRIV